MIQLKNVTLRRGTKVVLDGASVTLNPGEKAGLVGRNGAGKSSLFALLTGVLHEDSGDFSIPAQWRMAQVAQDMPETDAPATRFVVPPRKVVTASAWHTPTWRCTTPARTTRCRVPRRCCWAWGSAPPRWTGR